MDKNQAGRDGSLERIFLSGKCANCEPLGEIKDSKIPFSLFFQPDFVLGQNSYKIQDIYVQMNIICGQTSIFLSQILLFYQSNCLVQNSGHGFSSGTQFLHGILLSHQEIILCCICPRGKTATSLKKKEIKKSLLTSFHKTAAEHPQFLTVQGKQSWKLNQQIIHGNEGNEGNPNPILGFCAEFPLSQSGTISQYLNRSLNKQNKSLLLQEFVIPRNSKWPLE